jgi:hypothetical protein
MAENSLILCIEFYRIRELYNKIQYLTLHVKDQNREEFSWFMNSIYVIADKLNFDYEKFNDLLKTYLKSSNSDDFDNLNKFCKNYYKSSENAIFTIPNNLGKACDVLRALIEVEAYKNEYQVYDAAVFLKDELPEEKLEKIYLEWKRSGSEEIWVSYDFMDDIDAASHFRFRNTFEFKEFSSIFKKQEFEFEFRLIEGILDEGMHFLAFNLWLIDRIPNFINHNLGLVNFILKFIIRQQTSEGFWESKTLKTSHIRRNENEKVTFIDPPPFGERINVQIGLEEVDGKSELVERTLEFYPSNYSTALCSLNLIKHSISDELKEKGKLGAKWLLENQNSDGSWSKIINRSGETEPDLFITLLSLETLFRSEIPNIERPLKLGLNWIMKQQNKWGIWSFDLFRYSSFPLGTVLVLELEQLINEKSSFPSTNQYLIMSRDFLNSSKRFLSEESLNSRRLSIITVYHGIEFFLYSILIQPQINQKIFEKNETIGMFKALNKFQEYLKAQKQLKNNEVVRYRNSLDELKYYRDQIIHKGAIIDDLKTKHLVEDAIKFASIYSIIIFNTDILS